ncbi:EAL domain-containing protein, partial [Fusibacter tunisiensis]
VKNKPIHPPPALSLREQGGLEAGDFSAILVKVIDYNVASAFNLNLEALPSDVTLINKLESPLIRYLPYLLSGAMIIVLQSILILYLRNNIKKRKQVEHELLIHKKELTTSFIGAESLIRWVSPKLGRVSPLQLIQASEEMGLIVEIGKWIIKESFLILKEINTKIDENFIININISPVQLMHPNFYNDLKALIAETGVTPKNICLEMTETTLLEHSEASEDIIKKAKDLGLKIALDDFGTGYSSLSYFKHIPAEVIKIDKLFVDNIAENEFDQYTAKTIIELAHHKGLEVVAEGVESERQVQILTEIGCDTIQGYYYSKPISSDELMDLLTPKKK